MIAHGVVTLVTDLARKSRKYVHAHTKSARPLWLTYTAATHRIGNVIAGAHHYSSMLKNGYWYESPDRLMIHYLTVLDAVTYSNMGVI